MPNLHGLSGEPDSAYLYRRNITTISKNYMKHRILLALMLALAAVGGMAKEKQQLKVACVGNSITYGTGVKDREHCSYPAQLAQMLGEGYWVENFGKPGATLLYRGHRPYVEQEEFGQAMRFAADIVVIHLGVNDTDPRNWPNYRDEFVPNYRALIDSFRRVNPRARFLIARMSPLSHRHWRFESGTRDWHAQIQRQIEVVAQAEGAQLIDFYRPLHHRPNLIEDGIHPNAQGATLLARTVAQAITGDYGGLKMAPIYQSGMVLQHGRPLSIGGTANAGEVVRLSIAGQRVKVRAARDGRWQATLQSLVAGGPYTLCVEASSGKLTFDDVLAGEVWLCSGQSNMAFQLKGAATASQDVPRAQNGQIRFFDMKPHWPNSATAWPLSRLDSINELNFYKPTQWTACTPQSARRFSAVAYYFGQMLQDSLHIPVGLVHNAIGGSPAEAWVDRRSLEDHFPAILRDWMHNDFVQDWVRERGAQNTQLSQDKLQRHFFEPCYLFETGILPLDHFPIRGVIWYQGESNAHNTDAHEHLFHLLVDGWRQHWADATMPFLYVQLSSMDRPSWAWFRDAQRRLLQQIPHTGMAVSSDCGDSLDVHPRHKLPVGQRLARWALHHTYGHTGVVPSGPLFHHVDFDGRQARVHFLHGHGLRPAQDGDSIRILELAGPDHIFHPAQVQRVEDSCLIVSSPQVKHPILVRYGWQPFTRANLVNATGLPASTFRSEFMLQGDLDREEQ